MDENNKTYLTDLFLYGMKYDFEFFVTIIVKCFACFLHVKDVHQKTAHDSVALTNESRTF